MLAALDRMAARRDERHRARAPNGCVLRALDATPIGRRSTRSTPTRGDGDDRPGDDPAAVRRLHEPDRSQHFDEHGYGLWCVDLDGDRIGFTGLAVPWFRDGVEIGWRLAVGALGPRVRAGGGARVPRVTASTTCGFDEVISFTAVTATRSRAG